MMLTKLLVLILCGQHVLCCDPGCYCYGYNAYCNQWTMSAFPSGIPSTTEEIDMDNQLLRNLSSLDCSQYQYLQILYVRNNKLNSINDGDFVGCSALRYIYLTNTSLATIADDAFGATPNLRYLFMDDNFISSLDFISNTSTMLVTLSVNNNFITDIGNETMIHLINLQKLSLNNNSITDIENVTFDNLMNLQYLYLDGNMISDLDFISHIPSRLSYLSLNNNSIIYIEREIFVGKGNLLFIFLDGNLIEDLSFLLHMQLSLYHISLVNNKVKHIRRLDFSRTLHPGFSIDLSNNPVSCDVEHRPEPFLNFTVSEWLETTYDIRGPREACIVTPSVQNIYDSNLESIEIKFFVYCDVIKSSKMMINATRRLLSAVYYRNIWILNSKDLADNWGVLILGEKTDNATVTGGHFEKNTVSYASSIYAESYIGPTMCVERCMKINTCNAVNYFRSEHLCEYLHVTQNNLTVKSDVFYTETEGWHANESPCHPNPCKDLPGRSKCMITNEDQHICVTLDAPCKGVKCENDGQCRNKDDDYECHCPAGYYGKNCENDPCTDIVCRNSGTCVISGSIFQCYCQSGYSGIFCERNPCYGVYTSGRSCGVSGSVCRCCWEEFWGTACGYY